MLPLKDVTSLESEKYNIFLASLWEKKKKETKQGKLVDLWRRREEEMVFEEIAC